MNSTADSATKLRATIAEAMTLNSERKATANWQRAQRLAYGQHHRDSDLAGEEMILVDSTLTINHAPPTNTHDTHPGTSSESLRTNLETGAGHSEPPPSRRMAGTLAKLALGAALMSTGAGAAVGVPLLLSGGRDVVETVLAPEKQPHSTPADGASQQPARGGLQYILEFAK